jgi:hypothetical protein
MQTIPDEHLSNTDSEANDTTPLLRATSDQYSIFTTTQKRLIILAAALASSFSPLSANIYYPAINSIAKDLNVGPSQINLTITTYMVLFFCLKNMSQITDFQGYRYAKALHLLSWVRWPTKQAGVLPTFAAFWFISRVT